MKVGIEVMNVYTGAAVLNVDFIFENRGLDFSRKKNVMTDLKSVGVPCEDPITNAVNAAKPMIDSLNQEDKEKIELVIVSSESGIDFGKSITSYVHRYLGLSNNCKMFEIKQACFGCTAAVSLATSFLASDISPDAKVLVISSDTARPTVAKTYAEPTQSTGAVAMILSNQPDIMQIDVGAYGNYCFEVMDTFRPKPDFEFGDSDTSLLAYLDCLDGSVNNYKKKVDNVDLCTTFDYLVFHAPFGGMVKGAHRKIMKKSIIDQKLIEADFEKRTLPSLMYCMQVGNLYAASVFLGLMSLIDHIELKNAKRVGMFSYGSGCSSEFFSGVITPKSKEKLHQMRIQAGLDGRYKLSFEEYEKLLALNLGWGLGVENRKVDYTEFADIYHQFFEGKNMLVLDEIKDYRRIYKWS